MDKNSGGLRARIIFVVGTDTGVGKTVLTALLLTHLRQRGCAALGIKPFLTGDRGDAQLLYELQDGELSLDEVNPFHFALPIAPMVAARQTGVRIAIDEVLARIRAVQERCDWLLIEGAGGLLTPLGQPLAAKSGATRLRKAGAYDAATLIRRLDCRVVVVSANRLGTINHTLSTAFLMQHVAHKEFAVAMTQIRRPDISFRTNPKLLKQLLFPSAVFVVPFLGNHSSEVGAVRKNARKYKKLLARIIEAI